MDTKMKTPLEMWREIPSEDRAFYEEFIASAIVCAGIVLFAP